MLRSCPHSDSICPHGMNCSFSCATDAYNGTKVPLAAKSSEAALAVFREGVAGLATEEATILLQARYALLSLNVERPGCGYDRMAASCERASTAVARIRALLEGKK